MEENSYENSSTNNALLEEPLENNTPFTQAELDRLPLLDDDHTYPIDSAKKWAEDIAKRFDKEDMEKGIFTTPRKVKNALVVNTKQETIAFRNSMSVSSTEILMSDTTPELYIFNYEDDRGYAVIGADERALGEYTSSGTGVIDSSLDNPGLIIMLGECINYVYDKREELELLRDSIYDALVEKIDSMMGTDADTNSTTLTGGRIGSDGRDPWIASKSVTSISKIDTTQGGELLKTEWNQDSPYNNSYAGNCGGGTRFKAGCVPISYAQVVAYFRGLNNYGGTVWRDLANIEGNRSTTLTNSSSNVNLVSSLVRQIFGEFDHTSQGCDATSVGGLDLWNIGHQGNVIIRPKYNFRHGEWRDYSYNDIKQSIQNGSPVIIGGYARKSCCFLWWCWDCNGAGHQWVIDGYQRVVRKITEHIKIIDRAGEKSSYTYTYEILLGNERLHHNWGWGPGTPSWVIAGSFQSPKSNYARKVKIIAYITWNG